MSPAAAARVAAGDNPKGDVVAVARIAAIQAAKRTDELIPLCHQLPLSHVDPQIAIDADAGTVTLVVETRTTDRTGVEMEAMVAVLGRRADRLRHGQGHRAGRRRRARRAARQDRRQVGLPPQPDAMKPLVDGHGRPIGDVRISVTDRCNFRCQYCMPAEGLPWLERDALLSYEEIARLVGAARARWASTTCA